MTTEQINRIFAIVNGAMENGVDAIEVHARVNQTIERLESCLSADVSKIRKSRDAIASEPTTAPAPVDTAAVMALILQHGNRGGKLVAIRQSPKR